MVRYTGESAAEAVASVRKAAQAWAAHRPQDRASRLQRAGAVLTERAGELAAIVARETNKPIGEAYSADVLGVADLFAYWTKTGLNHLKPRKGQIPALDMPGKRGVVELEPVGVVAVISPWNYPVALPMRTIVPALLAGNGVVLKPSEFTTESGRWLVEVLAAELGGIIAVVEGAGEAGSALIHAKPDLVHFTGSTRTGRLVAVACAERGIDCAMELGGKDAAIVLDDAAIERTARGIAWGVVHNAGQDCASVERVIVHKDIKDTFLPALVRAMNAAAPQVPHLVTKAQREHVIGQLDAAIHAGGEVLCGGLPTDSDPIPPTLVLGVPQTAAIWRDESFGPVAAVLIAESDDHAVELANDSAYGLGGSVWGQDVKRAEFLARRMQVGMSWINNHAFTGALPDFPWVGRKGSGTGITSSPQVLDHLTRPRVIVVDKASAVEPWWYPYGDTLTALMETLIERQRNGGLGATLKTLRALGARNKALRD